MEFQDKTAIVTGAGSGIGRATAQALAKAGACVIVADIDAKSGEASAAAIREQGGQAEFIAVDMTDMASIDAFAASAQARFGAIDVLVNAAGWGRNEPFVQGTPGNPARREINRPPHAAHRP